MSTLLNLEPSSELFDGNLSVSKEVQALVGRNFQRLLEQAGQQFKISPRKGRASDPLPDTFAAGRRLAVDRAQQAALGNLEASPRSLSAKRQDRTSRKKDRSSQRFPKKMNPVCPRTKPLVLKNCSIGEFIENIKSEHAELKAVLLEEKTVFEELAEECGQERAERTRELTDLQRQLREAREALGKLKALRNEQVEGTDKLLARYKVIKPNTII